MPSQNPLFASTTTFEKALNDTFTIDDARFAAHFDSMWHPTLHATIDGKDFNFDGLRAHLQMLRAVVFESKITCLALVKEGNQLAERHRAEAVLKGGAASHVNAFCFAELHEDGRIMKFEEAIEVTGKHPMRKGGDEEAH